MSSSTTQENKHSYNMFAIAILTFGIVVGSGIFFVNQDIMASGTFASVALLAWILISFLTMALLYSFTEVSSATAKSGETGSLSTWATKFFNKKVGRVFGYFFVYINLPINIAVLTIYSSDIISGMILGQTNDLPSYISNISAEAYFWLRTILVAVISMGIISIIGFINSNSNKGTKQIQNAGMFFKLVPIFGIVVIFGLAMAKASFLPDDIVNSSSIWDFDNLKNSIVDANGKLITAKDSSVSQIAIMLVAAMPMIMFSFDGFIYSSNLQNETKSKKTFARGLALGMIMIVVLYLLSTYSVLSLGKTVQTESGSIISSYGFDNILSMTFNEQEWILILFNVFLIVSVITGLNGTFTASIRANASLSADNIVVDPKMKLITRNKNGVPKKAGYSFLVIAISWILLLRVFDTATAYSTFINDGIKDSWGSAIESSALGFTASTFSAASAGVVFAFLFYGFILYGAVLNRKTNKVEVDKLPLFRVITFISIIGVLFISILSIVGIIVAIPTYESLIDYIDIIIIAIIPLILIVVYFVNDTKLKRMSEDFVVRKEIEIEKFYK